MADHRFSLVDEYISEDTVEMLEELTEMARTGQLVGLAFIAAGKGRRLQVGWSGTMDMQPLSTLGALRVLANALEAHAENMGYRS